jgi:hypothetical protein
MWDKHHAPFHTTVRPTACITFPVDDVAPAASPRATCRPLEAVRALLEAPPQKFAADESAQGNPTQGRLEACWTHTLDCVAGLGYHPLIAAAHLAFSEHRPLVLSPDVIWVTIVQGLAQHVQLSPETHRARLVRHEGKHRLTVARDDLHPGSPENPWPEVVAELASQLRRHIGAPAEHFVCDFSTTGPIERTVSEVALLDVLQPYFSYNMVCICGIPSVTLEGTSADWRKLRAKVDLLDSFGLDWWLAELKPICDQFARAAEGDVDRAHWRRLYKIRAVYGAEVVNGWLGKLFPYTKELKTGTFSRRNELLDPKVEAEIRTLEAEEEKAAQPREPMFHAPGIRTDSLPRGLSHVPFTLTGRTGTKKAMQFLAGPLVVTQEGKDIALRPTLGWAVRESPPIEQALLRLAEHHVEPARGGLSPETIMAIGTQYLPTDVLRFYGQAVEATIHGDDKVPLYRVLPLAEWATPAWAKPPKGVKSWECDEVFRFAQTSDGTELIVVVYARKRMNIGAVLVGRRDGKPVTETGWKVAQSFSDFLLRALDGGKEPYFRRAGYVPPA